jgi:hypothetical protein
MTTGGHERCPGAPCPHDWCPHDEWSADLAADDALLDGITAGRAVEEPIVGDLDEDVERELAVTLIAWRRSVRQHPETWSVDVDRAAVLVTRARATSPRPRRLLPGTWVAAAAVAGLVVVLLWGTPGPAPGAGEADARATSADLDHASEALERGDLSEARIALARAERRLAVESQDRTAARLQVRYRALHDEVDAGTSKPSRTQGPRARSAPRSEAAEPTPRRSSRAPSSRSASDRATVDGPSTARSRTERRAERPTTEPPTTERPTTERPTTERPRTERTEQAAPPRGTPTAPATDRDDPRPRPGDDEPDRTGAARPAQGTTGPSTTDRDRTDRDSTEPSEAEEHDDQDDEDDDEDDEDDDDEDEDDED